MLYFNQTMDKIQLECHNNNNNNMTNFRAKIGKTQITQQTGAGDN
jgi:hypothetical protein